MSVHNHLLLLLSCMAVDILKCCITTICWTVPRPVCCCTAMPNVGRCKIEVCAECRSMCDLKQARETN